MRTSTSHIQKGLHDALDCRAQMRETESIDLRLCWVQAKKHKKSSKHGGDKDKKHHKREEKGSKKDSKRERHDRDEGGSPKPLDVERAPTAPPQSQVRLYQGLPGCHGIKTPLEM